MFTSVFFQIHIQPRAGVEIHLHCVFTMSSCAYVQYSYGFNVMYFMTAQVAFIENIQVLFIVVVARSRLAFTNIQYTAAAFSIVFIEPDFTPCSDSCNSTW